MSILFQETLLVVLLLSGVPLIAASCTGLCSALLQAVTQVQEQTITYAVKLLTLIAVLCAGAEYGTRVIVEFTVRIFESVSTVAS